jgi:hypothetical protein
LSFWHLAGIDVHEMNSMMDCLIICLKCIGDKGKIVDSLNTFLHKLKNVRNLSKFKNSKSLKSCSKKDLPPNNMDVGS